MELNTDKRRLVQWHPAFYANIQIEFAGEMRKMYFENEHQLGTKPKEIDVCIIKKHSSEAIKKNIGRIFRKYNIVEYKSPTDYFGIDDFYKVYGYACFYKADTIEADAVKINELTITLVCKNYPQKLASHLSKERKYQIKRYEEGIYYIIGDILPIQIIVVSELSKKNNLWLSCLTDELTEQRTIDTLVEQYQVYQNNGLYQSVMNVIVHANKDKFEEEKKMCDALRELFKDEFEENKQRGLEEGRREGRREGHKEGRREGLKEGMLLQLMELVQDNLLSLDEAVKRAKITREEFEREMHRMKVSGLL
ncbi:MAG: 3-isopropylmalate dehydrogenase [Lachnospiraceae bacterium]|nr:3-isopropylmalate dehydrogenase [Lachnospiraceae bacterium]